MSIKLTLHAENALDLQTMLHALLVSQLDARQTASSAALSAPYGIQSEDDKAAIDGTLQTNTPRAGEAAGMRVRGQPAPGKARRTKAEIAEDEAADGADATGGQQANISTGEERIDPTTTAEAEQDAADEQAEVDANSATKPTLDDIRNALGKYVKAYGLGAAQEDGPKLITLVCGEGKVKVSDVPEDKIEAVIAGVEEMIAKNPYQRAADL